MKHAFNIFIVDLNAEKEENIVALGDVVIGVMLVKKAHPRRLVAIYSVQNTMTPHVLSLAT